MGRRRRDVNEHLEGERPSRISRRTVAKGTAWAAPMIAVGVAAPAYAASQARSSPATAPHASCPATHRALYKGYALGFSAHNPFASPVIITITSMTLNGDSLGNLRIINLDGCADLGVNTFTIPANTDYPNLVVLTEGAGNSQAGTLAVTYTITGGPGGTVTASTEVGTTPPIQGGSCTGFTPAEKTCIEGQNRVG